MEGFAPLLRMLEKGWQFGAVVLAFAVSAWVMDRYDFPSPDVFKEWLRLTAWAGTAGFAIVIVSIARWLLDSIGRWRVERAERRADAKNVTANLETLTPREEEALYDVLIGPKVRFDVPDDDAVYYPLMRKKILVLLDYSVGRSLCELHPAIRKNRKRVLAGLKARGRRPLDVAPGWPLTWATRRGDGRQR